MFELTAEQVSQLAVLVLVLTQGLKIVYNGLLKRPKLTAGQMRSFVFFLSVPVGYLFAGGDVPSFADPMQFALDILALGTQVLIVSGLVYEYLLQGLLQFADRALPSNRAILAP